MTINEEPNVTMEEHTNATVAHGPEERNSERAPGVCAAYYAACEGYDGRTGHIGQNRSVCIVPDRVDESGVSEGAREKASRV